MLENEKIYIMGILNVTPDSFYDGGKYFNLKDALNHAEKLVSEGADIIDIGGESTRPFSEPVDEKEEIQRVIPVIKEIKKRWNVKVSIDSYKYKVVKLAVEEGIDIINDIYALRYSPEIVNILVSNPSLYIVLMHMQGTPKTMQINPQYKNVVEDIKNFFKERIEFLKSYNISEERIILDPGIGFGKKTEHNIEILKHIDSFKQVDNKTYKLLIGLSRKSFIGKILGSEENPLPPEDRYEGSIVLHSYCILKKVNIIRTHDVRVVRDAIKLLTKLS